MSKVNISPQIGSIDLSTKIDITVNNLSTDYSKRISIENVTNNVYALIENDKYFIIDKDKNSISFTVDLNVVENNTSSLISFFIYIENFIDGEYKLVDIIPANFTLLNENVEEFLFNIKIDPLFINIDEISNIKIDIDKKDKVIVSINDRLFNILSNEDGVGELSFRGKEVIDTEINSMQCFPIYIYTSESNFTKKIFTGYTLSILPSNVKVHLDIDPRCYTYDPETWEPPDWCFEEEDEDGTSEPSNPQTGLPSGTTDTCDKTEISIEEVCRINNRDITLLPNGLVLHSYLAVDVNLQDGDDYYNINKINLATDDTLMSRKVIVTDRGIVSPKTSDSDVYVFVEDEILNTIDDYNINDYYITIMDEAAGYQSFKIKNKASSEYYELDAFLCDKGTSSVSFENWIFGAKIIIWQDTDTTLSLGDSELSYITDDNNNPIQIINLSTEASQSYKIIESSRKAFIYFIAEGFVNNHSQLFYKGVELQDEAIGTETDWKQLTFDGNNKNPKIKLDSQNNLHIFWESDRTGKTQIYYGVLGKSFVPIANSVFNSMVDKQNYEILMNNSFYNVSDYMLKYFTDEYGIPKYDTGDIVTNTTFEIQNNGASIIQTSNVPCNNIKISSNPISEQSMAFLKIDNLNINPSEGTDSEEFTYQVSFDLNVDINSNDELSEEFGNIILDKDKIDRAYKTWKDEFIYNEEDSNSYMTIFNKGNNKFNIGRQDFIFDRFVPIVGSYKKENDLEINISKDNENVQHFVLGLVFEKCYFEAFNIQTIYEYAEDNNLSIYEARNSYIGEEEKVLFTRKAKMVLLSNVSKDNDRDYSNYKIIREFPEDINILKNNKIDILVNYNYLNLSNQKYFGFNDTSNEKYLYNISVGIDENIKFSNSFIVDKFENYFDIDIGFGIPKGGRYIADKFIPYKETIYDDIDLDINYSNINITSGTYNYNDDICNIPNIIRDFDELYQDKEIENIDELNMGLELSDDVFAQIPLTYQGKNQSIGLTNDVSDAIHIAWQSNLSKYWDIYYSSSYDKTMPFRNNIQITDTKSNSLMPSISVEEYGKRLITWHDNREGNYNIYSARSLEGDVYSRADIQNDLFMDFSEDYSCDLIFIVNSKQTKTYHFTLKFYLDSLYNKLYKTISTEDDVSNWYVNGQEFSAIAYYNEEECLGVELNEGEEYEIKYIPQKGDDIYGKVLYVRLV